MEGLLGTGLRARPGNSCKRSDAPFGSVDHPCQFICGKKLETSAEDGSWGSDTSDLDWKSVFYSSLARPRILDAQSGTFNCIVHVNRALPEAYLQTPGSARGSFAHPPVKIFSSPPAYAFSSPVQVTYPMCFDPSDWIAGVRPRVALKRQTGVVLRNVLNMTRLYCKSGW